MKLKLLSLLAIFSLVSVSGYAQTKVKVENGTLEGSADTATGVRMFKGIPYAQPPVGDLRWKPPQAVKNWEGVRKADQFGPRAMQLNVFADMVFRSNGVSEDCLYLNVWAPAKGKNLPVLVYYYGGGFMAGDGSEPRYDGANMAAKGIVAVSVNYRLGVFGFFAHPELTKESPNHASGNYAFLDQAAALDWVSRNIAAFGGDPKKITIAGESAGSASVSALMASPLSRGKLAGVIGESGAIISTLPAVPLTDGEANGTKFAAAVGAASLADLRSMSADKLLEAASKPGVPRAQPVVDGLFFPKPPIAIFEAGEQAHVPLMAGSNSEEMPAEVIIGRDKPTVEGFKQAISKRYAENAGKVLGAYVVKTDADVIPAAQDLASDTFIGFSTWKWMDICTKNGGKPTFYYLYSRPRPDMRPDSPLKPPANRPRGAAHSAEIEYAMGNLDGNKVYAWTAEDRKVSATLQQYFLNFIKTGNPNGSGVPKWPEYKTGQRQIIDVETKAVKDAYRPRMEVLEAIMLKK